MLAQISHYDLWRRRQDFHMVRVRRPVREYCTCIPIKCLWCRNCYLQILESVNNTAHGLTKNLNNDDNLALRFFTDEAWFHLSGYVFSQNYLTWSTENLHIYRESSLLPLQIGVWIAMSRNKAHTSS